MKILLKRENPRPVNKKLSLGLGNSVLKCESNSNMETSCFLNTGDYTINNSNQIIMGPGLYVILCIKNQKVYFGESKNVPKRLSYHWDELTRNKHECKEMQFDWNFYGKENFKFISLSVGTQWDCVNRRQQKEIDLINLNVNYVYNQKQNKSKKENDLYRKVVSYHAPFLTKG